uniref:Bidirectional sugar transporter SWEET n=1 Tax=Triticum urartu TaxID=4572 RepID=A0A8R7UXC3_TRIUA
MTGLSLEHPWAFAFGLLGNIISFTSLLAPIPTFYRIYKSKSTEGFQSVPYVVALFSAMLWIFYALVKSGEGLLITINAAGCVIETVYIVMYLVYAPRKAKVFTAKIILLLNIAGFGLILLLTLVAFHGERRVVSLGWICVGFSVCVFVAPLSIIGRVIKTKECGVHALLPLPHAHPQCRRLVPLRPAHQGQIRRAPKHPWLHLWDDPDGPLHVLHERDAGGERSEGGERGDEDAGGGARGGDKRWQDRKELWRRGSPSHRDGQRRSGGAGATSDGAGLCPFCRCGLNSCMQAWFMHESSKL